MKKLLVFIIAAIMAFSLAACSSGGEKKGSSGDAGDTAGDYYIDLTELGMKLTIYLRINEDGSFIFSNTTAFETNKSSGTVQKADDGYLMAYTSVNGEEKSLSEGLTSKFVKMDDGSLDFTVCERIYYGSASATSTSEEHPDAKLIAHPITEDYVAPSDESDFSAGNYSADYEGYSCHAGFYEDGTYLVFIYNVESNEFASEVGRYGVSTTQLAMTPFEGNRISNEVVSSDEIKASLLLPGSEERVSVSLKKNDEAAVIKTFAGEGEGFSAALSIYSDGTFEVTANGFTETGLWAPDSASGTFKIYPDHPSEKTRGANQVSSVPAGELLVNDAGKLEIKEFRTRTSEDLNRDKCNFVEE